MNGSESQHREEPQDENLGLDLVSQVASTSRADTGSKPKRWIFGIVGAVIVVVLAIVGFSLLNGGTKASEAAKASDAVSQTIQLQHGGEAVLSSSKSKDAIGVKITSLPPLDDSQQYVVWAVHEETGASVMASSSGEDIDAGLSPANDVLAIHITIEDTPIPDVPSEDTEASVDLPLDANASPKTEETTSDNG
ncbi:anti-sigma factor domain-containing protein [Glutamicibacter sp.]|uniref:anti-sigma factor domain-containing protein n=1 Tax=Glutamicibacter sp. TaxID=1931995 RepID=UPI0028BDE5F2|nr:anti-sigma factor [Glutamicibacter sp.]